MTTTFVYHAGALGDFITSLPTLCTWRKNHPDTHIVLLGKPEFAALTKYMRLIQETWDVESSDSGTWFCEPPAQRCVDLLKGFDTAFVFANSNSPIVKCSQAAGIPDIRHQPPFPDSRHHVCDYHAELVVDCVQRCTATLPRLSIAPTNETSAFVAPLGGKVCAIAPGSGSSRKNWPLERFAEVAKIMQKNGMAVIWLLGPAEEHVSLSADDTIARNMSLEWVASILSQATIYIGNDSGVSHLAAAVGCPTVAIFGASDPGVWAPRGTNVRIVAGATDCSPCHPGGTTNEECGKKCMESVTVRMAARAIDELLTRR